MLFPTATGYTNSPKVVEMLKWFGQNHSQQEILFASSLEGNRSKRRRLIEVVLPEVIMEVKFTTFL